MKLKINYVYAVLYAIAVVVLTIALGKLAYKRTVENDPEAVAIVRFDEALQRAKELVKEETGVQLESGDSLTLLKTEDGRYVYRVDSRSLLSGAYERVGEEHEFFSAEARNCLDKAVRYRSSPAGMLEEDRAQKNARRHGVNSAICVVFLVLAAGIATPLVIYWRRYQADSLDAPKVVQQPGKRKRSGKRKQPRKRKRPSGQDDGYWNEASPWRTRF